MTVVLQLPRVGVEAARVGLIPTEALARLLTDPDTRFRAVLHDPDTGALLAVDARVYRPGEATARFVRRRDGTCRFPGCATPADRSDIDHVTTFATGGDTSPPNLITLCRRHHRLKHHGGWTLTMTPTGVATWTNGIGQQLPNPPPGPPPPRRLNRELPCRGLPRTSEEVTPGEATEARAGRRAIRRRVPATSGQDPRGRRRRCMVAQFSRARTSASCRVVRYDGLLPAGIRATSDGGEGR